MVDLYCERTGSGLWGEPLNLVTNLAFVIAALASWRLARRLGVLNTSTAGLIALMVLVGIGSALFHSTATTWSRILDVVPILLFQLYFFWLFLRTVARVRPSYAVLAVAALLAASLIGRAMPHGIEWSLQYVPALVLLAGIGIYCWKTQKQERWTLIAASVVLTLAVFLRSADQAACPYFPAGTHFLWHVSSGLVMYLMVRGLAAFRAGR